jgi:hypothetical protein
MASMFSDMSEYAQAFVEKRLYPLHKQFYFIHRARMADNDDDNEFQEEVMETIIQTRIPEKVLRMAEALVQEGWSSDLDALVVEALRRYIESHKPSLTEAFIRDDVQWGLHGDS